MLETITIATLDNYFSADRSRKALLTTDNELKLIAAPAIIGFSRSPKNG